MRAEAVFAVLIKVVSGGAPQEAVVAALGRTAVVLGAHEQEREFTELPIGIAKLGFHHCEETIKTHNEAFSWASSFTINHHYHQPFL